MALKGQEWGSEAEGLSRARLTAALGSRRVCGAASLSTAHAAFNLGRCLSLGSPGPHKGGGVAHPGQACWLCPALGSLWALTAVTASGQVPNSHCTS